MRYRVQVLGWTLIWSGLFIFGYIGWQLWVTDWLNAGVQAEAATELEDTFEETDPVPETIDAGDASDESATDVVQFFPEDAVGRGESFAFLTIPKLGLEDVVVYQGVDRETLKSGPGHMESTPLPGQPGNAVLSGHRTTYGRPFHDFDLLESGDEIEVESAVGTHVYAVREIQVVEPTDIWVTDPRPGGWITMTTCEPKFSARQRLVVWAEMVAGPNFDYVQVAS